MIGTGTQKRLEIVKHGLKNYIQSIGTGTGSYTFGSRARAEIAQK